MDLGDVGERQWTCFIEESETRKAALCKVAIRLISRGVFKAFDSRALAVGVCKPDG
jgi:hypothetical protein